MAAPIKTIILSSFRSILPLINKTAPLSIGIQCRYLQTSNNSIKRFYKKVSITRSNGEYEINLDQRRLKTPMGSTLRVPNEVTALAIAAEWDAQEDKVQPSTMHFTKLANTVVDNPTYRTSEEIIVSTLEFLDTDTVCYNIEEPEDFAIVQEKYWGTLISAIEDRYNVKIPTTSGFEGTNMPDATKNIFRQHLLSHNKWSLTGYHFTVEAMKSFIIGIGLCDGLVNVEDAVYLARLEQEFQMQKWGRVDWYHDVDMYDMQAKVSAASSFVHFFSEQRDTVSKG